MHLVECGVPNPLSYELLRRDCTVCPVRCIFGSESEKIGRPTEPVALARGRSGDG